VRHFRFNPAQDLFSVVYGVSTLLLSNRIGHCVAIGRRRQRLTLFWMDIMHRHPQKESAPQAVFLRVLPKAKSRAGGTP